MINFFLSLYLRLTTALYGCWFKFFTWRFFTKGLTIFAVGFISRSLVYYFFGVNVFVEFCSFISLSYYFLFSFFIVILDDVLDWFSFYIHCAFDTLISHFFTCLIRFKSLFVYFVHFVLDSGLFFLSKDEDCFNPSFLANKEKYNFILSKNGHRAAEGANRGTPLDHGSRSNPLRHSAYDTSFNSNPLRASVKNSDLSVGDKIRRRVYWLFIEKGGEGSKSYQDFKRTWRTDLQFRKAFIHKWDNIYAEEVRKWEVRNKTFKWFTNRRKP